MSKANQPVDRDPDEVVLPRDRYTGVAGSYVVVDGERFPADEAGRPLPHTRNADGSPIAPSQE